jgi:hypothetical protein
VPYKIHTVLTDNGIQFTTPGAGGLGRPGDPEALAKRRTLPRSCLRARLREGRDRSSHHQAEAPVDQRPGRANEPHHQGRDRQALPLRRPRSASAPPHDFVSAYNFGRRLKTLKGLTPYEFICKRWTAEPDRFMINPLQQMPGLNR